MATPGQLVSTMADALGIPKKTVAQFDRQLAEAGLRSSGGRGKSAARIIPRDAANLLIAILGAPVSGPSIAVAASTCLEIGKAPLDPRDHTREFRRVGLDTFSKLSKNHTFGEAVETLIKGAARGEHYRIIDGDDVLLEADFFFVIKVRSEDGYAEIFSDESIGSQNPSEVLQLSYFDRSAKKPYRQPADLHQERRITFRTIRLLGGLVSTG